MTLGDQMMVLTPDEIMQRGLELIGKDWQRQQRVKLETNIQSFNDAYGSAPIVYAAILEDLFTTNVPEARVDPKTFLLDHYLMALHWLYSYPKEGDRSGRFNFCLKTARKWAWFYAEKIQELKKEKVSIFNGR